MCCLAVCMHLHLLFPSGLDFRFHLFVLTQFVGFKYRFIYFGHLLVKNIYSATVCSEPDIFLNCWSTVEKCTNLLSFVKIESCDGWTDDERTDWTPLHTEVTDHLLLAIMTSRRCGTSVTG